MKKLLVPLLCITALAVLAQSTNNLSVVLPAGQDAAIKAAYVDDLNRRTNGLPPYSNALPAQTFKAYVEGIAAEALSEKTIVIESQREALFLKLFREATPAKRRAALQALQ